MAKTKQATSKTKSKTSGTKARATKATPSAKKRASVKKATTKTTKKKSSPAKACSDEEVTIDRRRAATRRKKEETAEKKDNPTKKVALPKLERREKVQRRRQIDPTTCERDYSDPEIEFMSALDDYKRKNGRMFPTCSEVLEVLLGLGYAKLTPNELAIRQALEAAALPAVPEGEENFGTDSDADDFENEEAADFDDVEFAV